MVVELAFRPASSQVRESESALADGTEKESQIRWLSSKHQSRLASWYCLRIHPQRRTANWRIVPHRAGRSSFGNLCLTVTTGFSPQTENLFFKLARIRRYGS